MDDAGHHRSEILRPRLGDWISLRVVFCQEGEKFYVHLEKSLCSPLFYNQWLQAQQQYRHSLYRERDLVTFPLKQQFYKVFK